MAILQQALSGLSPGRGHVPLRGVVVFPELPQAQHLLQGSPSDQGGGGELRGGMAALPLPAPVSPFTVTLL